jgi:hypothetical protein
VTPQTSLATPLSPGLQPEDRFGLSSHLERVLANSESGSRRISSIEWRPSAYQSSCSIDDLDVKLEDGSTIALVAKAVDWRAMCPDAQRARPRWLWDETRERTVYESILPTSGLTTAPYLSAYVSRSGVRYLLLERIAGVPLWQLDVDAWCAAARWLARMSRCIAPGNLAASAAACLLTYDRRFYRVWMERAVVFHAASTAALQPLFHAYDAVVEWLLGENTAFLHGEFYSSNVLVERSAGRSDLVRPVDWEMAAIGPASIDLACLLAGRWTDYERALIADVYYRELASLGGPAPPRERYLKTLDYSLIHLSVRNLGWSGDWTPPPDRSHDWLSDALALIDKWNL